MGNFKSKTLAIVPATAMPIEPTREGCADLTDAEFKEFHQMYERELEAWKEAQTGTPNGGTADVEHGPGHGWKSPEEITGPGAKK